MFIFTKEMPNGAIAKYHKAIRFEVHTEGTHAVVNSFHKEEMDFISWQDTYVIPLELKVGSLSDVETILTLPGAPFDGGEVIDPLASDLTQAKSRKWAAVKSKRSDMLNGGCDSPKGKVDCSYDSLVMIGGRVQMAQLAIASNEPFTALWKMFDNTWVEHNAQEMIAMGLSVGAFIDSVWRKSGDFEASINSATTIEDLNNIDINAGWPS